MKTLSQSCQGPACWASTSRGTQVPFAGAVGCCKVKVETSCVAEMHSLVDGDWRWGEGTGDGMQGRSRPDPVSKASCTQISK